MEHLIISKPIQHPKGRWRLHVKVMHGDADGYETNTEDFAYHDRQSDEDNSLFSYEELNFKIKTFQKILALDNSRDCTNNREAIREAAKETNFDIEIDDSFSEFDKFWEILPQDTTCDLDTSQVVKVWVTFFDDNGTEFEVILPDGKVEWTR